MSCSCHPEPGAQAPGVSRRRLVAGGLAAGLVPFVPGANRIAGASGFVPTSAATAGAGAVITADDEGFDGPPGATTNDFGFLPPRPTTERHVRPIMYPVLPDPTLGRATWSDTYLFARSGGRRHEGQDLMGNKMLKLLACVSGTIVELRHQASGNSLYLKGDDGWYYCYLHINNDDPGTDNGANRFQHAFAPGMATGKRVLKGEHIAYLGDSGNAEATAPHLHFEIRMPNERWYNAAAVNPKFSLDVAEAAKVRPKVDAAAFAPMSNGATFAIRQAVDFLGGIPSQSWLESSIADLEGGVIGLDAYIESLLALPGAANQTAPTIRLYLGYFLRVPDHNGLEYWIRQVRAGRSLDLAATQFAAGSEFTNTYGSLDNRAYVRQIYRNLFEREPDPGGFDYWTRRLDGGAKRGWVMRQLCESSEYTRKTASQVRVIQVYNAMLRRAPDPSGYAYWTNRDATVDGGLRQLISTVRTGASYANRFAS